jgi:hypothetical protein
MHVGHALLLVLALSLPPLLVACDSGSDDDDGGGGPPSTPLVLRADDGFGNGAAAVGDLDGDGVAEVAVSATGVGDTGGVWILFLNPDGTVKGAQLISASEGGGPALDENDSFGSSLAALGDLDGDGVTDLLVGANGDDDGQDESGAAYVVFLNRNGTAKAVQKISQTAGNGPPVGVFVLFGVSAAGPGDVDGDGIPDALVGAPFDDDGAPDAGAAYVLFLRRDGTVRTFQKTSATQGGGPPLASTDDFGSGAAALGDLDGDGVPDVIVGASGTEEGGANQVGAVYTLLLNRDGTAKSFQKIGANQGGGPSLDAFDAFGGGAQGLGDFDGDGVTDVLVGALFDDDGATQAGAVYLLFLRADGTARGFQKISATQGGGPSLPAESFFGVSTASLGDLDGDGVTDVLVGAPGDDDGGENAGAAYVLFLNTDGTVRDVQKISATEGTPSS